MPGWRGPAALLLMLALALPALGQKELNEKLAKAAREAARGNAPRAEKLYREAALLAPRSPRVRLLLGDLLAAQRRLTPAIEEFSAALKLDDAERQLSAEDRRHAYNQMGVSYALNSNFSEAEKTFKAGLAEAPGYALLHYNLACTYAETGDLDRALASLKTAWEHRQDLNRGESFPDPRRDPSFQRYLRNPRFQQAINHMVF